MTEDRAPAQERVWSVASEFLETLKEGCVYRLSAELDDELLVIDRLLLAILSNLALHIPGRDDLFVCDGCA